MTTRNGRNRRPPSTHREQVGRSNGSKKHSVAVVENGTTQPQGAAEAAIKAKFPSRLVEVASKYGMRDPRGEALLSKLSLINISSAREIRVSSLYEITGKLTTGQIQQISRDLLSDPITQEYRTEKTTPSPAFLMGPHWRVEVWLKPSVTDPIGQSVRRAVTDMGFPKPQNVRAGIAYSFLGRLNKNQIEKIASKLLSNPVIHITKLVHK